MSNLSTKAFAVSFVALALAAQACTLASPTEVKMVPASGDADDAKSEAAATDPTKASSSSGGSSSAAASTCKLSVIDTSKLTACGDGAGHCYPKSKVPASPSSDKLMPCADASQVCIQDTILKAGGNPVTSCKVEVMGNAPGACMALGTMPEGSEKEQAKGNLKQDACAAGEICAPCKNPLAGNADTGLCGPMGVSADDCTGGPAAGGSSSGGTTTAPAPAAACCGGKGSCMDGTILGDTAKDMSQDTCTGSMVCAPSSLISGKATTCTAGVLQGKGICMDGCFNSLLDKLGGIFLDQDVCATGESCVSCLFAKKMAPEGAKVPGCD